MSSNTGLQPSLKGACRLNLLLAALAPALHSNPRRINDFLLSWLQGTTRNCAVGILLPGTSFLFTCHALARLLPSEIFRQEQAAYEAPLHVVQW